MRVDLSGLADFQSWVQGDAGAADRAAACSAALEEARRTGVATMPGWCVACGDASTFRLVRTGVEPVAAAIPDTVNWREVLTCEGCGLNNRARASFGVVRDLIADPGAVIWLAEQTTPLYRSMSAAYPALVGSEYLDPGLPSGSVGPRGHRHEDVTASSFAAGTLDAVVSFDVLEHVPDYPAAFAEAQRVLRPGGWLIWTAPFVPQWEQTQVRARIAADGSVEHLHPPIYHADPLRPEDGVLCFQHFGWDVLDSMRQAGFAEVSAVLVWSDELANLGDPIAVVVGRATDA